ncbi:MAG: hypothetical protein QW631_02375 [Candidatus Aenigmatarchaeota archaeon]
MVEPKRMTAIKTEIASIINGRFIKGDGLTSSFVITKFGQKISRVRILASVIDKFVSNDKTYANLTLDDGSATIRAKAFQDISLLENVEIGDKLEMIGRLRSYADEIYIVPEIVQKVEDEDILKLRKLEIKKQEIELKRKYQIISELQKRVSDLEELKRLAKRKFEIKEEEVESILLSKEIFSEQTIEEEVKNKKEAIIKLIEKLDTGMGCEYSTLIKESGLKEDLLERIINELLNEGVCFEPRPGIIKLL